jgi:hypothetical protein
VEDDGAAVGVLEDVEVVLALDGVLAGAAAGAGAGVDGDEDAGWSDLPVAASFFSPALATGGSLPEDGFILSE